MQKVEDFVDYLELISNKDYDLAFRKQAIEMAENLFANKKASIINPEKELTEKKEISINKYIESVLNSNYSKIETEISTLKLSKSLGLLKKGDYWGEIYFTQTNSYYKDSKLLKKVTINKKAKITLIKTNKKFGNKEANVWNVFLVDIKSN